MQPILCVGDTNDLAPNQTTEINIGICQDKRRGADIESIRDSIKRIPRPDSIAEHISPTTVDRNVDICSRLKASRIEPWVSLQDAFNADIKFPGYSAYGITSFN